MKAISLNGNWKCKPDLSNIGIKQKWYIPEVYAESDKNLIDIEIPKSYNLLQDFEYFEGIFWHFFHFDLKKEKNSNFYDYIIKFEGSNYNTKVWCNGYYLGMHNGGFTPFSFDATNIIRDENNFLVVRTDNYRKSDRIPSLSFDWFNWGGIYRDVNLLELDKQRIEEVRIKTNVITKSESEIVVTYKIIETFPLKWQILDSSQTQVLFEGVDEGVSERRSFTVHISNPQLWSPEDPYLYHLLMFKNLPQSNDKIIDKYRFGIRQINIKGTQIYLNKRKMFLKGVSLHEEYMPYGRTIPYEKRVEDIENIKKLGFNTLRTAHYSHDESLVEIADRIGILLLEEIPVYQHCDFGNSQTYNTAANMLKELIKRDFNHPSVSWWSGGNEAPLHRRNCAKFIRNLMDLARNMDDTRIVTCVSRKIILDLTRKYIDVATINTYFGWYFGHEKMINLVLDIMRTPVQNKPWIYTEFGAGAKFGFRADWNKQLKYSEEKQLEVLDYTIRTINSKDYYAGWLIWIYRDFKSIKRNNLYQQGFNRKGIVSDEKNEKKLIYYRLPKIIDVKRKSKNMKLIGLILWIIFYPISYLITTRLIDIFLNFLEKKQTYLGH
ncbi:MAG: glycoside hydrolase family 2 protein [Promethearchaeota archaeon]